MIELFNTGILYGLVLVLVAFGIMIPFRFLDFPDLTSDGAYPLGGAVCAMLLLSGMPQAVAIICGVVAGGLLAVCTAQIALKLKINSLLAGIIISIMAYSVNLRIMGKPNVALFDLGNHEFGIVSLAIILLLCFIPFAVFLRTDYGLRFRTVGSNPKFAKNHGIGINKYTTLGLFIAGCLFGLAGALIVQMQQFMDVGIGVGIVIHGLASLMVGEAIVGNSSMKRQLLAPVVGALVYQQIQGFALSFGLAPSDLKFFTGAVVLIVLLFQRLSKKTA